MRCSFEVACEGLVVADLQEPAGAYSLDNSFTFIHILLVFHSHFVFCQGEHICYKYSTLTSVNGGMSLKYDCI